jgi:hypothetical protein
MFGAVTFTRFNYNSILFPGVFIGLCGLTYRLLRLKSDYFDFYRDLEVTKEKAKHEMVPLISTAPVRGLEA